MGKWLLLMSIGLITNMMAYEYIDAQEQIDDIGWYRDMSNTARKYANSDCNQALEFIKVSSQNEKIKKLEYENEINKLNFDVLSSSFNDCTDKYNDLAVKYLKKYTDQELKNKISIGVDGEAFELARIYYWGKLGQKKDTKKALEYYLKAYEHMPVMNRGDITTLEIGRIYYEMKKMNEAYPYLWLSARRNLEAKNLMEKLCTESPKSCTKTPKAISLISSNNAIRLHEQGQKLLCSVGFDPTLIDLSFDVINEYGTTVFYKEKRMGRGKSFSRHSTDQCILPTQSISITDYIENL